MDQEKKKVDTHALAKWLSDNLHKGTLKPNQTEPTLTKSKKAFSMYASKNDMQASSHVQMAKPNENSTSEKKKVDWKLPPIHGSTSEKLTEQLKFLVEIFEEMEN